jgi:dTDP-4-dehydrorhamnose 3,5-epimerase
LRGSRCTRLSAIPEVLVLRPKVFEDARGFFFESYHRQKFADLGIRDRFVQDNHSRSQRGTLRGLHYQLHSPQAKLCRVVAGEALDVVVDIRVGSPTFGKHVAVVLSGENKHQIYVPRGFAHGFAVLSESCDFLYKCDDFYQPDDERGVRFDDPALGIDWKVAAPLLSPKDRAYRPLAEIDPANLPHY